MISNLQEIRARGAYTIVIAEEGDDAVEPYADEIIWVPAVPTLMQPLVTTVPLQVFACELATAKGTTSTNPATRPSPSRSSSGHLRLRTRRSTGPWRPLNRMCPRPTDIRRSQHHA